MAYIRWFETLSKNDVPLVGGKNASLGEMVSSLKQEGIAVPNGFATTAEAYYDFIEQNQLREKIAKILSSKSPLAEKGKKIRALLMTGRFSPKFEEELTAAYQKLGKNTDVAVRSSATAEDLPDASFAGQQETFLHIQGIKAVLTACKKCYASLFTDRAITYRETKGFEHLKVALSIGIQEMVRSDKGGSGVLFTLDPESGFRNVVVINASWGLGETVVQGSVIPDEYIVFKPTQTIIQKTLGDKEIRLIYQNSKTRNVKTSSRQRDSFVLADEEIITLAQWGMRIEEHYRRPMDIEWAKDGKTGKLFIVQARPETVQSQKKQGVFKTYSLKKKGTVLLEGLAIGEAIATGKAQVIKSVSQISQFVPGSILITTMTSPDWVPIMKQAKGIITDHGGRTSHAAIVSRELGIPAIVGTQNGTRLIQQGRSITLSCAEGEKGHVYDGILEYETQGFVISELPEPPATLMMNISSPDEAFQWWQLPCKGIGLARMEFIINNIIKIHPMALVHLNKVKDAKTRRLIEKLTRGYSHKEDYFVDHLARGIARIAAARYPDPVIVRMSDFKTNEYAHLIGGSYFEPHEENPMLGFRGASRYYNEKYREGFALECKAIKRAREKLGMTNIIMMIPFCRTLEEADRVLQTCADLGLKRGKNKLQIYMMAEIPSNVVLAEEFAQRFDGFSIGSNDLTQLVLGIDRDSEELSTLFDERNPAVKKMIAELIEKAHKHRCKVGICGQAPSDYPEFAQFLVDHHIDSISLNPDSIISTIKKLSSPQLYKIAL
ncbi:MAG: phosphoenolpyruvate synthase [Verrucomicrobia bacterium]|nr:phosphoenolpyruvate synthase [Verrucomicrobiota bacterium]